jgi:hypothetical protein
MRPVRAESVPAAIKTLSKAFREIEKSKEPEPEPFRPENDQAAVSFIKRLIGTLKNGIDDCAVLLKETYKYEAPDFRTRSPGRFLVPDPHMPMPQGFDDRGFSALSGLHLFRTAALLQTVLTTVRWLKQVDGETASDLAVRLQRETSDLLDRMLPELRYAAVAGACGKEAATLDAAGWVHAHMHMTPRLRRALSTSGDDPRSVLISEMASATFEALDEREPGELFDKMQARVSAVIEHALLPDGSNRRSPPHGSLDESAEAGNEVPDDAPDVAESVLKHIEDRRILDDAKARMNLLSKREGEVLLMTTEGKTSIEIGSELGIEAATARKLLQRARSKLSSDA